MQRVCQKIFAYSWDSFPLFQLLNDYLTTDANLKLGMFHTKLINQFSPMVVRYIDLMEHSILSSIEKNFFKEKWEMRKDGCGTSEDIYWKLDALQGFIQDLNWPEEEFAKYLQVRMRNLASEIISKCASCTYQCFDQAMQRTKKTLDWMLPSEICVMVNVVFMSKARASKIASGAGEFHSQSKLDDTLEVLLADMGTILQEKLLSILEFTLSRLARYDEGNPLGALLSIKPNTIFNKMKNLVGEQSPHSGAPQRSTTATQNFQQQPLQQQNSSGGSTAHLGQSYVHFLRGSSELLQQIIVDEVWVNRLLEDWYDGQMRMLNDWLTERLQQSLSAYQLTSLSFIVKKIYSDFELHGIDEERLNGKTYQSIQRRIQLEETNSALTDRQHLPGTRVAGLQQGSALLNSSAASAVSMVEEAGAKVFAIFGK